MDDRMDRLEALLKQRRQGLQEPKKPVSRKHNKLERKITKKNREDWASRALAVIKCFKMQRQFTAEDVQEILGTDLPRHKNAWGAVFKAAQASGLIQANGQTRKSMDPKARGRRLQVWNRVFTSERNPTK